MSTEACNPYDTKVLVVQPSAYGSPAHYVCAPPQNLPFTPGFSQTRVTMAPEVPDGEKRLPVSGTEAVR
jgi:hypothetical protein